MEFEAYSLIYLLANAVIMRPIRQFVRLESFVIRDFFISSAVKT